MMLFDIINRLKKKEVDPKVYVVVLFDTPDRARHLWFGVAYSFEEAVGLSRASVSQMLPNEVNLIQNWIPALWSSLDLKTLIMSVSDLKKEEIDFEKDVKLNQESIDKNKMMLDIVQNKNFVLYCENKEKFNQNEQKFLETELKIKKNVLSQIGKTTTDGKSKIG